MISRTGYSGERGFKLIVKPAKPDWDEFFDDPTVAPEDFLVDREDAPAQAKDLF